MIASTLAAGLLVLSLVKTTDSACASSQATFVVDNNPIKGNRYFLSKDVSSAAECAAICFDHPFCLSAGFNPGEGGKLSCLLSYVKQSCPVGEPQVTTYSATAPVLLRCMICGGSTFAPFGVTGVTVAPIASEVGSSVAGSTAGGETTVAASTVGGETTVAASTVAGETTVAASTVAGATGAESTGPTPTAAGAGGNETVEVKIGTQHEFPGSLSGGAETKTGKCRYKRFPGVNVKHTDAPGYTTGVGTVASLNLTEGSCAQTCGDHPYCDYAIYREAPDAAGVVKNKYCDLLTPPLQFFKDQPTEQKVPGYVEVFLDDIECAVQPYPGCSFESKLTTLGSFDASLLAGLDVFNTRSGEFCAGQCYVSSDCDVALFELNSAQCYFLNNTAAQQIESSGRSNLPVISDTKDRLEVPNNYYLLKNTKCDAEFLHNFKRQQPGFTCDRPGTDDASKRVVKVADIDPTDALTGHNVYANYTAILRGPDVNVDVCQFTCAADPRCDIVFFATTPEGAKSLQTAAGFGGEPAKCVMYQYDQLELSGVDAQGFNKYVFANKDVKTKPGSGITQYTEIGSCNGLETYPPDCEAKSERGNFKVPEESSAEIGGYPVMGPDECDHLCADIGGCQYAFFKSVPDGDDICYLFNGVPEGLAWPKGFERVENGSGYLRSKFQCGNVTAVPNGIIITPGPDVQVVTIPAGEASTAAATTAASGNGSNIDAIPVTKGVEGVTNATEAPTGGNVAVTNATVAEVKPIEGILLVSSTAGTPVAVTNATETGGNANATGAGIAQLRRFFHL